MKIDVSKDYWVSFLREHVEYKDGGVYWKLSGRRCGTTIKPMGKEYRSIKIKGLRISEHRAVYALVNGSYEGDIDHINGDGTDNRIENLRVVSHSANMKNKKNYKNNKTGVTGVTYCNTHNLYVARIGVNGKKKTLGYFKNIKDAIKERKDAELKYGYHTNHGR